MNDAILSSVVIVSTGEYSDYSAEPYKVNKPFTFGEALSAFRSQWVGPHSWMSNPSPAEFVSWLCKEGYIEPWPVHEVHVGSYSDLEISDEAKAIAFVPHANDPKE